MNRAQLWSAAFVEQLVQAGSIPEEQSADAVKLFAQAFEAGAEETRLRGRCRHDGGDGKSTGDGGKGGVPVGWPFGPREKAP